MQDTSIETINAQSTKTVKANMVIKLKNSNVTLTFSELLEVKDTDYLLDVVGEWQKTISKLPIMEALNDR